MKYISTHNQLTEDFIYNDNHSQKIYNPTEEQLELYGWTVYQEPKPQKSYAEKVTELIRERYTIDDELAISRQRETKPDEFKAYFDYCEECKKKAKNN